MGEVWSHRIKGISAAGKIRSEDSSNSARLKASAFEGFLRTSEPPLKS